MIDLQQVQAELSCAGAARLAAEAAGCEIEELLAEMQRQAWHHLAFADPAYDPHLFERRN